MAISMLRATGTYSASVSRRSQVASQSGKAVQSFARFSRPYVSTAAYRRRAPWDRSSVEALESMLEDMAKQFDEAVRQVQTQPAGVSGGFIWPGVGYVYGSGRCGPYGTKDKPSSGQTAAGKGPAVAQLPLDVVSAGDFYLLYADVPGLAKSDLSIKLSGPNKEPRVIKISGQRTNPFQQQQQKEGDSKATDASSSSSDSVVQQQRVFGSFSTSWELPADADSEGISAKVTDGVLTVTVPKKQPKQEEEGQEITID